MHRKSPPHASKQVPALAEKLLLVFSPADERDALAGDLAEEYLRHRLPTDGTWRAWRWYWGQVLRSLIPGLARPQPDLSHDRSLSRPGPGAGGGTRKRGSAAGPLSRFLLDPIHRGEDDARQIRALAQEPAEYRSPRRRWVKMECTETSATASP